jgi:hypothetical protein
MFYARNETNRIRKLLDRAGYLREHVVGIAADQANGAYNDYQDYGQHDGILRNVLPFFITPQKSS